MASGVLNAGMYSEYSVAMKIRAVLFDAYGTLFDVHSVALLAEQLFPGCGERLKSSIFGSPGYMVSIMS